MAPPEAAVRAASLLSQRTDLRTACCWDLRDCSTVESLCTTSAMVPSCGSDHIRRQYLLKNRRVACQTSLGGVERQLLAACSSREPCADHVVHLATRPRWQRTSEPFTATITMSLNSLSSNMLRKPQRMAPRRC